MVIKGTHAHAAFLLAAITAGVWLANAPGTAHVPATAKQTPSTVEKMVTANPAAVRADKTLPPVLE